MINISIVTPVFNEKNNIQKVLAGVEKSVKTGHEVLVVYDFPEDSTVVPIKEFIRQFKKKNIKLVRNSFGSGRGVMNAIKTGFNRVSGKAAVVMMADLSDDISQIDEMYLLIEKGNDIVCASRYMKGGKKIGGPLIKTFMSRMAGLSLRYLFGLPTHDATNAFKMYKKEIINKFPIQSTGGFEYSMEITLKAYRAGYKITEIPTTWRDRTAGKSNFKLLKWLPQYLKQYSLIFKR